MNVFRSNHFPELLVYVAQYLAVVVDGPDQIAIGFAKNQLGRFGNGFPNSSIT